MLPISKETLVMTNSMWFGLCRLPWQTFIFL